MKIARMLPLRTLAAAAALGGVLAPSARAEAGGFDARSFRPSTDAAGVGTIDGAHAPDPGVVTAAVSADVELAPVVLYRAQMREDILRRRIMVDPALTFGLGSGFAVFARVPVAASDDGVDAKAAALSPAGLGSPIVGAMMPLFRSSAYDGRTSLRGELALPLGDPGQFRGDGALTGRLSVVHGMTMRKVYLVASAGAHLAPVRGIGDAVLGSAATLGVAARYPAAAPVAAFVSADARIDARDARQSSAMLGGGCEIAFAKTTVRVLGGAGVRDVIGTPTALFSIAILEGVTLPTVSFGRPGGGEEASPPPAPRDLTAAALPALPAPAPRAADALPLGAPAATVVVLAIPPILFANDSDVLDGDALRGLAAFAARVASASSSAAISIRLVGHADDHGHSRANDALGIRRAIAVRDFLGTAGVPIATIEVASAGDTLPARGRERTDDDRLRDRRVEVIVDAQPLGTPSTTQAARSR